MLSQLFYETYSFLHRKGQLLKIISIELSEKQKRGYPVQSGISPQGELLFFSDHFFLFFSDQWATKHFSTGGEDA